MIKTSEEIKQVREMASQLQELGLPQKLVDKIRIWARQQANRLRDEAREHSH
jgi:hypothetical protein